MIAEYATRFWAGRRRRWEHENIEVATLDEDDPNNIQEYLLSVDAANEQLIDDVRSLATNLREGEDRKLKLGVVMADNHAYKPLLYATGKGEVVVQPVPLDDNERKVVDGLVALARAADPCLGGRELFLIRNRTRGRGVSFFDDYAYYPDFIVWLKDDECQHVAFLDPKGLGRYGPAERSKVALHTTIKKTEAQVRMTDPDLRLHAFVLSVTAPDEIGDEPHTVSGWQDRGVYFLARPDWAQRLIVSMLD